MNPKSLRIHILHASAALLTLTALPVVAAQNSVHATLQPASERKAAPEFVLKDSSGKTVRLRDYRGKVVLLDFWATWCHGCKIEIPWYMEFQRKYEKSGFSAIGVSMDDDGWKSVRPFLEENKLNYPIVIGDKHLADLYGGVPSMPMTLLIDQNGKIADSHAGMVDKDVFESEIQELLRDRGNDAAAHTH